MRVKVAASRLLSAQYYHGLTDHSTGGQSAGLGAIVRGLLPKQNKPPRMGLDAELRRRHGGCRRMLLPLLLLLLPLLRRLRLRLWLRLRMRVRSLLLLLFGFPRSLLDADRKVAGVLDPELGGAPQDRRAVRHVRRGVG